MGASCVTVIRMTARFPRSVAPPRSRSLTAVLASLLAAALVVVGVAPPASASTRLTVSGPAKINVGSSATLTLGYTRSGSRADGKVTLQARTSGGSWTDVRRVKITRGKTKVKVKPTRTTSYRIKRGSKVSKAVKVKVARSWIGFTLSAKKVRSGDPVTARIQLVRKGERSSGLVRIQRKTKSGWRDLKGGKVRVPASGLLDLDITPTTSVSELRVVRGKLTSKTREVRTTEWARVTFDSKRLATSQDTARGTVSWWAKGKGRSGTVTLQQKVGSGKWTDVQKITVTKGTGTFTVTPTTTRAYRVRTSTVRSPKQTVKVASVIPASFTIVGSGWGHGLGMSQYGAYAMAQEGKSVEDILTHYYTDTAVENMSFPTSDADADQLAVQIVGSSPDNRTSVTATVRSGGWRLMHSKKEIATGKAGETITFKVESGKAAAYLGSTRLHLAKTLRLTWEGTRYYKPTSSKKTYVEVQGTHGTYRHGRLQVTVKDGRIHVVNQLLLNTEYLYGIAEMPSSWGDKGPAALEAQAIAARNYAAAAFLDAKGNPKDVKSSCRCHVVDDTNDQNFTGWKKENEGTNAQFGKKWKAAVDATVSDGGATGKVLRYTGSDATYRGELVTAYYSSSSGGATLNSEDAWSAKLPYIRSVDDPWSLKKAAGNPYATWEATMTQREARAFFGLPDVVSVRVSKTYRGGGIAELAATSSSGQVKKRSGKADAMRTSLNAASSGYVRSAFVKSFKPVGVF